MSLSPRHVDETLQSAYSHEESGLVKRADQEVIRRLTAIIADKDIRENFPTHLPLIQRILNSQVNQRTGVSPTQIIFGNAINHDSHILSGCLKVMRSRELS